MIPAPAPPPLPPGYQSLTALSERVWLAHRESDGLRVAVKFCPSPTDEACREALRVEAALLDRLAGSPAIVESLDWRAGPLPLLVTRFEKGHTLAERYQDRPARLDHRALCALLAPLLAALRATHRAGYLHRDLSPHNILLREPGDRPLLLDFGAARPLPVATDPPAPVTPSATAQTRSQPTGEPSADDRDQATPGFAPPERYRGDRPEDPTGDIYSLAAIGYGLVTGTYPPPAPERGPHRPLPRPTDGDFPAGFIAALVRGLALDPAQRYPDIDQFAAALGIPLPEPDLGLTLGPTPADPSRPRSKLPPTERIRRRPPPATAESRPALPTQRPARPDPAPPPVRPGLAFALLVALLAAAGHWGPAWYRQHLLMDWRVDPAGGGDALTISEALAGAPSGAEIRISPGTYRESLVMDRPLTLRPVESDPSRDSAVRIRPAQGPCLRISAANGHIDGLDLAAAGSRPSACVVIDGGAVVVQHNRISAAAGPALLITGAAEPTVGDNRLSAPGGPGVRIQGAGGGTLAANRIESTGHSGIAIGGGAVPVVQDNRIDAPGQAGILVGEGSRPLIENNRIRAAGRSGIEVRGGARPRVRGNRIDQSQQTGLYLHAGAGGQFTHNQVLSSRYSGVLVADGAHPLLADNTIANSGEQGVLVLGGGARLERNELIDNAGHALVIAAGAAVSRAANRLSGNRAPPVLDANPGPQADP